MLSFFVDKISRAQLQYAPLLPEMSYLGLSSFMIYSCMPTQGKVLASMIAPGARTTFYHTSHLFHLRLRFLNYFLGKCKFDQNHTPGASADPSGRHTYGPWFWACPHGMCAEPRIGTCPVLPCRCFRRWNRRPTRTFPTLKCRRSLQAATCHQPPQIVVRRFETPVSPPIRVCATLHWRR